MQAPEAHTPTPRSFGDFLRAYAMIVLSIVTALALERLAVAWQNQRAAAASRVRIEAELALNIGELKQTIAANHQAVDEMTKLVNGLIDQLNTAHPDEAAIANGFRGGIRRGSLAVPTWRRDAWDSAIADQSASHMAPRDLRRYTEIYTGARDLAEVERITFGPDTLQTLAQVQLTFRLNHPDAQLAATLMLRFLLIGTQIIQAEQLLLDTTGKA
jgi:hypothetical protein